MKMFFQQILKGAKAKSTDSAFLTGNKKSKAATFEPAPAYWALIPVRVQHKAALNIEKNNQ